MKKLKILHEVAQNFSWIWSFNNSGCQQNTGSTEFYGF